MMYPFGCISPLPLSDPFYQNSNNRAPIIKQNFT
jgi:hypothetical protein